MSTATMPRPPKFAALLNTPQIIALAAVPGRMVPSEFGPSEVVFTLVDGRPWYVPQVIADHIYALGIEARQQIEVTGLGKKKTEVAIVPVQARIAPRSAERDYTPELAQSIANAQARPGPVAAPEPTTVNQKFLAAYMVAVDTLLETKVYAQRKGLALEIQCEDVRALAATLIIDQQKGGR